MQIIQRHFDFVAFEAIDTCLKDLAVFDDCLASLGERDDMIVFMTEGTVTTSESVKNRIANRIHAPASWISTFDDLGLLPAEFLLLSSENTVFAIFVNWIFCWLSWVI